MVNEYNPDSVSAPGETIKEIFWESGNDMSKFCKVHNIGWDYFFRVLEGQSKITPRLRNCLCYVFGTDPLFWEKRDRRYWEWKNAKSK
jgi:plasmid maintenance system antidote protein VapI